MKNLFLIFVCASIIAIALVNTNTATAQTTDTIAISDTIQWADLDSSVQVGLKASEHANKPMSALNYTDVSAITIHYISDYPIGTTGKKTKPEIWAEVTNNAGEVKNVLMMAGQPVLQHTDADGNITSVDGKGGDDPGLPKRDK